MKRFVWLCLLFSVMAFGVQAQDELVQGVQHFEGSVESEEGVFYDLFSLKAGQTVYAYARGLDDFDTYLAIGNLEFTEVLDYNDDADDTNAALSYEIPEDGDYSVWIAGYDETTGDYLLIVGIDTPEVLTGNAEPTGNEIAVLFTGDLEDDPEPQGELVQGVQHFEGTIDDSKGTYYDFFGLQAGQTIYAYAEGVDEFDTILSIGDINFEEELAYDDDGGEGTDAAVSYEIVEDGDYSIWIAGYDEEAQGEYRLILGVDAPDVLTGEAEPTGNTIAELYIADLDVTREPDGEGILEPELTGDAVQGVQHFEGTIDSSDGVYYDLFDLQAGQTVYLYVRGIDNFDTYVAIGDIDFVDVYAENDDGGNGTDAALSYEIPQHGDYSVWVAGFEQDVTGDYVLMIGVDAPEVLTGEAEPTGDEVAVLYTTALEVTDCSTLQERPELSGDIETVDAGPFLVHYTREGIDKTTQAIIDGVVDSLAGTWDYYIVQENWPEPPRDCGEGGDERFDVYIKEILDSEELLGYVQPEALVGDNPSSDQVEEFAAYSYLVLDNNFDNVEDELALLRTTVAHEFMHSLQFGYDINDTFNSIYESTAAWMETQVFPEVQDATPYASDYYTLTDLCMGSDADSFRHYGEWLLIDSMVQDYGPQIVRELWEHMAYEEGIEGFYNYLEILGTTPQEVAERLAIRNLLRHYDLADEFDADLYLEGFISGAGGLLPADTGVQELGADYVRISTPGRYHLQVSDNDLKMIVVGIDSNNRADIYELGVEGVVDTTVYENAYLILINMRQHTDPATCEYIDWELTVSDTSDEPGVALDEIWDASHFIISEVIMEPDNTRGFTPSIIKSDERD